MNKKYGTWTRLMALCLTLLLAVGVFGTAALAAPIVENTGSISVTVEESDVAVNAYQVMTVNFDYESNPQQPVDPVYSWSEAVKDWVSANYPAYINADGSVTEDFTVGEGKMTAEDAAAFYDALAAAIKGGTITLTASGTCIGSGTIDNLPMGGYLILVENGMKVYRPSAVNIVPAYNETTQEWEMSTSALKVKYSDMTMDKTINEDQTNDDHDKDVSDQAGIGETVNFDLRTNVPQYPEKAIAKTYAISDTLSAGLTLVEGSIKVYGVKGDVENELAENTAYTKGTVRPNNGPQTSFTLTFDYDQIKTYEKIHVDYNAVVNKDAVVGTAGNPNKAVLDYNNNPYDENSWKEQPDEVKVYTYGLKVNKVNNADELLTGAEFTLSKDGINLLSFVNIGDGTYRVATDEDAQGTTTTTLQVGANGDTKGKLNISGLPLGTFYLTETKVPAGYNKPSNPTTTIEIKDADLNGQPTINNDTTEFVDGFVALDVVNTKGFKLPTTGGMGTFLFTMGGVAIMGAAILLFFVLRRRKAVSDK